MSDAEMSSAVANVQVFAEIEPLQKERIVRALDRRRAESFQPEWWRIASVAQALAPGAMARVARGTRARFG